MNFLKRLTGMFASGPSRDAEAYWLFVQCEHCGETLRSRVDLRNDLSIQFGEGDEAVTYFCRKHLIGSSGCYKPIEVELTFDSHRRLIHRQVSGGEFVEEA